MHFILRIKLILITFAFLIVACSENSTNNSETGQEIAEALWQQLSTEDYSTENDQWTRWPGKKGKHLPDSTLIGADPHIGPVAFQTFCNSIAISGLNTKTFPLANKSIIVKENYTISGTDTTLAAITAMLKKKEFDADNNDWFWVKYNPDGSIAASGKVDGCINCHGGASATDFLWTRLP